MRGDAGHTEQEITYLIESESKSFLGLELGGELIISDMGIREHVRDMVTDMANHVHSADEKRPSLTSVALVTDNEQGMEAVSTDSYRLYISCSGRSRRAIMAGSRYAVPSTG